MWIYTNLTKDVADNVYIQFVSMLEKPNVGLLSFGLLLTLWAASNGMNATMTALDRCYNVTRPRPFWQQRGVAIAITLCGVVIVLMLGLLLPTTTAILKYFERSSNDYVPAFAQGGARMGIDIARYSIGITLVILLVSSIYQFGVSIRRRWTLVTPGAVFAVFGVMGMAYAFNWYVERFGAAAYSKTYGVLGGVVIVLLLFNLYAVVFLIGAEINSEIDFAVLEAREREGDDPLPDVHETGEMERFRKQLERRGAKFVETRRKRADAVEAGDETKV
jgi:membrane protein